MIAAELVRRGAMRHRDRVAVHFRDERITFAQVMELAEGCARTLLASGVAPGSAVGLLLENGPLSLPIDFALLIGGYLRVPLNARLAVEEHASMVAGAGCTVLLHEAAHTARAAAIADRVVGLRVIPLDESDGPATPLVRLAATQPSGDPGVPVRPEDPTLALYTSGTTGRLKAAVHTQASWVAITTNILTNLVSPEPDDVMLHAASLIHASGTFILPFWVRGASAAVLPSFTPTGWLDAAERYGATTANLVPSMLQMLLAEPAAATADLSRLSTVIYGASPMPRPVIEQGLSMWGPRFTQYYGQTEIPLCVSVLSKQEHVGPDADTILGSCGRPSVEVEIRLIGADGLAVADGEPGEIQVRAPSAMRGYHNAPELDAATMLADGWIATRDVARRDGNDYLYLVDRTSDMIISGGYNVYPREVEDALLSHPLVVEAAVVGAPDEVWVEAVTAFVVLTPGAVFDEATLRDHVRATLAGYKVPKRIHLLHAIPKSAVGKVLRRALRDPLWEGNNATRKQRL